MYAHTGVPTIQRRFTRDYSVALNTSMTIEFRRIIALCKDSHLIFRPETTVATIIMILSGLF